MKKARLHPDTVCAALEIRAAPSMVYRGKEGTLSSQIHFISNIEIKIYRYEDIYNSCRYRYTRYLCESRTKLNVCGRATGIGEDQHVTPTPSAVRELNNSSDSIHLYLT
mmetsp:Transcript_3477/g.7055  ORF Transcript_3477/g.7055 Transcript_3477/m.7055 type:complete len:109 (-) Transcript_3477:1480-1806(-)